MPDYILALNQKRAAIIKQKGILLREYEEKRQELDCELDAIDEAIAVMNDAVKDVLCQRCGGSGVEKYCDAAGDMDDRPCPSCHGTGIRMKG